VTAQPRADEAGWAGLPAWREHRSGSDEVDELLRVLDVDSDTGDPDTFVGSNTARPHGRLFGGQILAQSVVAAARTVDPGTPVHSLHAYFIRMGRPELPVRFTVDRLRDGRSFHTRRIDARQDGVLIASTLASYQSPEQRHALSHQDSPPVVDGPDSVPGGFPFGAPGARARSGAIEMRSAVPARESEPSPDATVWMRVPAPLPDDPLLHQALLIYASDYSLVHGAFRYHQVPRNRIRTASIDHAIWLHRAARMDDWVVYHSHSPSAGGARAMGTGRMFTASGLLLASAGQEMVTRLMDD
jgi:acyl-CoA thioesterase-2